MYIIFKIKFHYIYIYKFIEIPLTNVRLQYNCTFEGYINGGFIGNFVCVNKKLTHFCCF